MTNGTSEIAFAPARTPRGPLAERLLHVDPGTSRYADRRIADLPGLLRPGDLVVVNDAATLPASLCMTNHDAELRLLARERDGAFRAVLLGAGDSRTRTEDRPAPPRLALGDSLAFGALEARVVAVDPDEARLLHVRFDRDGGDLLQSIYRVGRAVQYAYLDRPLELWDVQNRYASRPWAFEAPSAGRPLTFGLFGELRMHGVELAVVTHAAGLSSTGAAALDRRLPLPEMTDIPVETVETIERTKARGGRVLAVGTTVVRALEGRAQVCARESARSDRVRLSAGESETSLVVTGSFRPRVVNGVLSGLHDPSSSHFALLQAFAERSLLLPAFAHAARAGYLEHEFGDSCLVLSSER